MISRMLPPAYALSLLAALSLAACEIASDATAWNRCSEDRVCPIDMECSSDGMMCLPPSPSCGDGARDDDEDCDDGNRISGDGCDSNCTITACGNGIQTPGETCDDGDQEDGDACNRDCTLPCHPKPKDQCP